MCTLQEVHMKRAALAIMLGTAALALSAQAAPAGKQAKGQAPQGQALEAPKSATLSGVLAFSGEDPAVKTEADTVVLDMPKFYYYAYSDGLKAGMAVKVKGYLMKAGGGDAEVESRLIVTEMTINGKTYVVPALPGRGGQRAGKMGGPGGGEGMPEPPRSGGAQSGSR
jgi:hypothetical protein